MRFNLDVVLRDAPAMLHSINKSGTIINVSDMWAAFLGYRPSEMIGEKSTAFLTGDSRKRAQRFVLPEFWDTGRLLNVQYDFVTADGDIAPVSMSAIAIKAPDLRSIAWMTPLDDVKEKAAIDVSGVISRVQKYPEAEASIVLDALSKILRDLT